MSKNRISAGWWSPWLLGGTSEMISLRTWTKLDLKLALLDGFAYWRFRDRKRPCPLANFTQFLRIESQHVFWWKILCFWMFLVSYSDSPAYPVFSNCYMTVKSGWRL
jgi:hypothetical protein